MRNLFGMVLIVFHVRIVFPSYCESGRQELKGERASLGCWQASPRPHVGVGCRKPATFHMRSVNKSNFVCMLTKTGVYFAFVQDV